MIDRLMLTFVIETIDTVDGCALMVAAEDEKVLGIFDFVREQQADCFE